jgi:hypothetical protein
MLELRREKPPTGDSGGQLLVIYHAEPDAASDRSLALLGPLASRDGGRRGRRRTRAAHLGARIVRFLAGGPGYGQFWRK